MENNKIIEAVSTIFKGADEHNWKSIESVMAKTVLLDYASFTGGEPATLTPKQITESWAAFLLGFDKTHHQLSNFNVTVNNDVAHITYAGKADHFTGNEIWTVEGMYESELNKVEGNWWVSKLKFNFDKQSGNTDLAAKATARMKK
jgi:SnoaL-like domain